MKIAILSTADYEAGTVKSAYNLYQGLLRRGVDCKMFVQKKYSSEENVVVANGLGKRIYSKVFAPKIEEFARKLLYRNQPFHSPAVISSIDWTEINKFKPDIINLQFVFRGYFRPEDLKKFNVPIVWTMPDMWSFCGGEHYSNDRRYIDGYYPGNKMPHSGLFDFDRLVWQRKKKIYDKINSLHFVAPSHWMAKCAQESFLLKNFPVSVIANGLDLSVYQDYDQLASRKIFNLPADKKIILFGAINGTDNPRKGFVYLIEAINQLPQEIRDNSILVSFGKSNKKIIFDNMIYLPQSKIIDQLKLARLYAAADVFVAPSLQDNLPNTIMEALACGTPVVAFDSGGIGDMIKNKNNGYLAKTKDAVDLANGIKWILTAENYNDLAMQAREICKKNFNNELKANKYIDLFKSLIKL